MSTHRHFDLICVAVLLFAVLLTVLFMNGSALGIETLVDEDAERNSGSVYFTKNDRRSDWSTDLASRITLKGDSASVSGGAYFYEGDLIISNPGYYVISGTLNDGSIVVDAKNSSKVWILLDGVSLYCSDDACLRINQADKVFLTLAEGSENSMASGAEYSEEALADRTGGTIYAHDDLTINGSGSLTVTAAYRHGIDANDELVITGGTVTVDAAADALHVSDDLSVENAVLTLRAGDDGIDVNRETGWFYLASGTLSIESTDKGISTVGEVIVDGGSLTIASGDDGISAGGLITVNGGETNISAGDDGVHSDTAFSMTGGSLLIAECYEGIEALTIDISGGEISIFCSDDGLNANGGSGGFGMPGFFPGGFGRQNAQTETGTETAAVETWIRISGGSLSVVNTDGVDADGLDSNGDIIITGGSVRVSLSGSGSNSAIDYGSESGGVCEISGGDVVACGSYAMAEGFSDGSTQCSILYVISGGAAAGTEISLEDTEGNVLIRYEAPCSFTAVNLSCPEMQLGESYLVVIGEKVEAITIEEVSASYGNAQSEGFGGTMNWGGMQQRGRFEGFGNREDRTDASGESGEMPQFPGGGRPQRPESSGMPQPPEGFEMPEGSEMPQPPEGFGMSEGSEMPQPPEGFELPEGSGMPQPPEGFELPEGSGMPQPPEGMQTAGIPETEQNAESTAEQTLIGPQPVGSETWLLLGACFLVLFLGIFYAVKYKV